MWRTSGAVSPRCSEGRGSPAPWRRRGLRLQAAPHCRLPTAAAFLHKYELGTQLGRGNFGTVWEARERATGRTWAAKVVAKSSNKLKMLLLSREIQVLKMVEHPNIVYLREIFETPENVYLILELCEHGELATFCRHKGKISETDARTIITGITSAIQYLHKHGIVHRDLKLENVLLASPGPDSTHPSSSPSQPCAKLSDFGLAEVKDKRDHDHMMELFCGTPYCMAPEILSERAYSQQCDVWSMGVILYTLIAGSSPYMGGSERDVLYSIHRHPHLQDDPALATVTDGARDLLSRMLHLDPAYRITAAEVVAHPWVTDKCMQASASQDILTLMKEWRIEATDPDTPTCEVPPSEQTQPDSQRQTADLEKQTDAHKVSGKDGVRTGSSGTGEQNNSGCGRSGSSRGGQSGSSGGGHSGSGGGGQSISGGKALNSRAGGSAGGPRARQVSTSDSEPAVRPASGPGRRPALPARPHQSAHRLSGPCRTRAGPRPAVSAVGTGGRRPTPAASPVPSGVIRRRWAAGVPLRPGRGASGPH
ncbi:serine/threonine-protein kinase 33-like [Amphibalanus amphitrite]|uniref:serine/threonine-protein kinase 33-like n=1 Tax=Amphibalanus amphitrite TaxID=1232801 RepID=UPI001C915329|nr:serine/threonine-protein kinase 33-like [Amphibalanus amphitrite]XP_043244224.1 serine/threonine-protein kinase 33-like [Amphibalanus amphitrite]XP_043244225.1 serine/threonine-protein kinase 33-like [Amphibalanus amphitrite]